MTDCQVTPARTGGSVNPAQRLPEKLKTPGPEGVDTLSAAALRIQQAQLKMITPILRAMITLAAEDRFRSGGGVGTIFMCRLFVSYRVRSQPVFDRRHMQRVVFINIPLQHFPHEHRSRCALKLLRFNQECFRLSFDPG